MRDLIEHLFSVDAPILGIHIVVVARYLNDLFVSILFTSDYIILVSCDLCDALYLPTLKR